MYKRGPRLVDLGLFYVLTPLSFRELGLSEAGE
jgi:hypothetical protein